MRGMTRRLLPISLFLFCFVAVASAQSDPLKFKSSTQFLWGDDLLGESQAIVAQYLRFGYDPAEGKFSLAGYGRLWKDLGEGQVRDDDLDGRIYYLHLDYAPSEAFQVILGRQFLNFTAGTSIVDGATIRLNKLGPFGLTIAGGRDVVYSLDSEDSRDGNYFGGVAVHLNGLKSTQAGVSYVRKYDESDLAREEFGANFRYFFWKLSPYAEVRYDHLSKTIDEATAGLDVFPVQDLTIKAEFYHSYPTFDSTSIYSVFAVDRFQEYLVRAEVSVSDPLTIFAEYAYQTYDNDYGATVYAGGVKVRPLENLTVHAEADYRCGYTGYDGSDGETQGDILGFEVYGDYRIQKKFAVYAGAQFDVYDRPDEDTENDYARRFWLGGQWQMHKNIAVSARIEDNVNENFEHQPLGRVALDWTL